jgi:peptide/nickel transport system substrate-binding protein
MHLNRRDNAVVAALVLTLVVLGGALAIPASLPQEVVAEPTPAPSIPPPVTYREGVVGVPESITPLTARTRSERTLVGLIFSGLMRTGPDQTLQPDLAASWEMSEDGRSWTFVIRDDASWQDGTPVTAADVVYTVEALKDPDAAGAASRSWAEVTATAVDERTVRFDLMTPVGGFLAAATQPLLPAHLLADVPFTDLATSDFAHLPVGTSAFALTELDEREAVLVPVVSLGSPDAPSPGAPSVSPDSLATPVPHPTPGAAIPYVERIEVRFYPDDAGATRALADGEIDAVAGLGREAASTAGAVTGVQRVRYPTTTLSTVLLNLRPSHPELRSRQVRRALAAALDRDALVRDVLEGEGSRADALVPPTSWAFDETSAAPVAFDTAAAVKLLTDAGWTKVKGAWAAPRAKAPYELQLLSVPASANERLAATADFVRDAWTALGFRVTLVEKPAADIATALRAGTFTSAVLDIAMGVEPDLYPLLASSQVRASGSNLSGYQDATLDVLLEAARAPGDDAARTAAWKALLAGIATRQPMLPLAWQDEIVLMKGVQGVTPTLIADTGDRFWDVLAWRLAADR